MAGTEKRTNEQYADELRALGFPDAAIKEAVAAHRAGLFALEPSPDLADRIAAACAVLHPPPRRGLGRPAPMLAMLGALLALMGLASGHLATPATTALLAAPVAAAWFLAFEAYVNPRHRDRTASAVVLAIGLAVVAALVWQGLPHLR